MGKKTMKLDTFKHRYKRGFPLITLLMGMTFVAVFFLQKMTPNLQYDRAAIASGELWRIITSHWVHWSFDHFLWCTVTFVALGCVCERISRKGYIVTLAASIFVIPAVLWLADPEMVLYRGLSGLASAVFIFGAAMVMRTSYLNKDWPVLYLSGFAGFGLIGKILFEYISGETLFVNSQALFTPAPLVHLAGGVVGLAVYFKFRNKARDLMMG